MTDPSPPTPQAPIAVVGIGAMYPGSSTAEGFWRDIVAARDRLSDVPATHWLIEDYYDPDPSAPDKVYCRRGGFLPPVEFDPIEFGVPPTILASTDTSQLLALIVARDVLDDVAGGRPLKLVRDRTSVVLGFAGAPELVSPLVSRLQRPIWAAAMREQGLGEAEIEAVCDRIASRFVPWDEASFPGLLANVVAGRVANRLDLHGANLTTDAACASSLAAVHTAVNQLLLGEADLAIAGGVDANNDIFAYICFSKTPAISRTEDCRPFSEAADGTVLGEGLGMVALKRLADAERDGNRIYAVIRGIGFSSDGRSKSIYAPRSDGQVLALERCYARAGYGPGTVELLEAHGTGTPAGDRAEMESLRAVFATATTGRAKRTAVGSVKSQIGHTKAAAGAAGLLKAVMALDQKVLPPTIKVDRPDPGLQLDGTPLYLNIVTRPWVRDGAHPRRASVSAFGFGGTNYHVALEEYVGERAASPSRLRTARSELFLLADESPEALAARALAMSREGGDLSARAFTSQAAFDATAVARLAIVADSAEDLSAKLAKAAGRVKALGAAPLLGPDGTYASASPSLPGEVAVLFPGQGSQYVMMGADLALAHPAARRVWDEAATRRFEGIALHEVVFPPPVFGDDERQALEARLRATEWAQPALGLVGRAAWALLDSLGLAPRWFLGHSFGELTALCAAGSLAPGDLLTLARRRGELMRDAAADRPGAMVALFADTSTAAGLIERAGVDAVIANYNSDDEVVVAGSPDALDQLEKVCAVEQVTARRLPVSAAFHSPLVAGVSQQLAETLADMAVRPAGVEVLANSDAEPYPGEADAIRQRIADQLVQPVRFADMVRSAYRRGARLFVETGPGSVLSELTRRILKDEPHLAVSIDHKHRDGVTSLHHALAQLCVAGLPLRLEALWERYEPPAPRPPRRAGTTVTITGTNYGKIYPPGPERRNPATADHLDTAEARTAASGATAPIREAPGATPALAVPSEPVPSEAAPSAAAPEPPRVRAEPPLPVTVGEFDAATAATGGGPAAPLSDAWATAYDDIQRRVAEAHIAVTRSMAEMHAAFLATMSGSFADLGSVGRAAGGELARPTAQPIDPSRPAAATSPADATPQASAVGSAPPVGPAPAVDLAELLLSVIAAQTGYQPDMLAMDMELEADLGIDSIKRVEILAAMRDAVPGLPEVQAGDMAAIRTLGDVVERLRSTDTVSARASSTGREDAFVHEPAGVERLVPELVAAPTFGLATAELAEARLVLVADGGSEIGTSLVRALAAVGIPARPWMPDDELADAGADVVIDLGGLADVIDEDGAVELNRRAFRLARTVAPHFAKFGGLFVTVQDTGGFGLSPHDGVRAWLGGIAALARTARQEWPAATVKAIDIERGGRSGEALAEAILAELLRGGGALDVALTADGARYRPELVAREARPAGVPLEDGAVVVVSGGARGVTAACLEELAGGRPLRLVLLGRTALVDEPSCCAGAVSESELVEALIGEAPGRGTPPAPSELRARARSILSVREVRATLERLTSAGTEASYLEVDVRDETAVVAALTDVRGRLGPIRGLVHGAGVVADKLIADKREEQFDSVFDTKVLGLRALLRATRDDPLALLVVFSSVAGQVGNAGQCDYAMANEVLNHVATVEQQARGSACSVHAIGWGPWETGMVTPSLRKHFGALGVPLLSAEAGRAAFVTEIGSAGDPVVVVRSVIPAARATEPSRDGAFAVWIDRVRCPYLADHAIAGTPVIPVALVAEWFHRTLADVGGDRLATLRSLKVQRPVKLASDLVGEGLRITRRWEDGSWRLTLLTPGGQPAFVATADFESSEPGVDTKVAPPGARLDGEALYDGFVLFHGPMFRALRSLEDAGGSGMSAEVAGLAELGWPDEGWRTDPCALDAMLQLGSKWAEHCLGAPTLPMGVGTIDVIRAGPLPRPMRATVRTRELHHARAVCDIALAAADGSTLAVLGGVDYVVRPDRPPEP